MATTCPDEKKGYRYVCLQLMGGKILVITWNSSNIPWVRCGSTFGLTFRVCSNRLQGTGIAQPMVSCCVSVGCS